MANRKNSSARRIYVDVDDVLCETAVQCLRLVEREFGRRVKFEDLVVFDLGASCGLTDSQREHLYRVMHEPEEILDLSPIPEAIRALREWTAAGFEIAIVTGRPPDTLEATQSWLDRHEVPYTTITVVDKYGRFDSTGTCAIGLNELREHQYAWAVEDSLPMAHFLAEDMGLDVLLIDRPWNQSADLHSKVSRQSDWGVIARYPLK